MLHTRTRVKRYTRAYIWFLKSSAFISKQRSRMRSWDQRSTNTHSRIDYELVIFGKKRNTNRIVNFVIDKFPLNFFIFSSKRKIWGKKEICSECENWCECKTQKALLFLLRYLSSSRSGHENTSGPSERNEDECDWPKCSTSESGASVWKGSLCRFPRLILPENAMDDFWVSGGLPWAHFWGR